MSASLLYFSDKMNDNALRINPIGDFVNLPFLTGGGINVGFIDEVPILLNFGRNYSLLRGEFDIREIISLQIGNYGLNIEPFGRFEISQLKQKYHLYISNIPPISFSLDMNENLVTDYYDLGGGLALSFNLPCHLTFYIEGKVLGSFANTRLSGNQAILLSNILPIEQLSVTKSHHIWSSKFGAKPELSIRVKE